MSETQSQLVRMETELSPEMAALFDRLEGKGRAEKLRRAALRLIELERGLAPAEA